MDQNTCSYDNNPHSHRNQYQFPPWKNLFPSYDFILLSFLYCWPRGQKETTNQNAQGHHHHHHHHHHLQHPILQPSTLQAHKCLPFINSSYNPKFSLRFPTWPMRHRVKTKGLLSQNILPSFFSASLNNEVGDWCHTLWYSKMQQIYAAKSIQMILIGT